MENLAERTAIAMVTFYNPDRESDRLRASLARASVKNARDFGHRVTIVDGGSADELLRDFERYGAIIFSQEKQGMGNAIRQSMRAAYNLGIDFIALTEPEKVDYIPKIQLTSGVLDEGTEIVIPKRRSKQSYPQDQQFFEEIGNAYFAKITGRDFDVFFGPRTFRRNISSYFLDYNGEYGDKWDSIFVPVIDIIHKGVKIDELTIDYTHSAKQTQLEEQDPEFFKKRLIQSYNLLPTFKRHWERLSSK
jgi:glycosyltransferase involved in cell wall biosynthesis